jgi:hypothetical protein
VSGLWLAIVAGGAWYLAHLLGGLVEDGDALVTEAGSSASQIVEGSTEGMQTEAALFAASSAERFAHDVLGEASTAVERFQLLVLASLLAGAFALAVAMRRLPLARWPEVAWIAAAALTLLPAVMLQLWLIVAIPVAGCFGLAAGLHLTRRHDLTLARGTAAARRQVGPHAQAIAEHGTRVTQAGREQLPQVRDHAESLGRKGHALAQRSAPIARASLRRFRRGSDDG